MSPAPYTRRERIAVPARNIPLLAARLNVSVAYLIEFHLAHGGQIDDATGDLICWIAADKAEADA